MPSPSPLAITLLGGFAVRVSGREIPPNAWQQRRAAAIVKLLALQPQYRLHREILMETLWPDLDIEPAANNLRVAMHRARQRLEDAGAPAGRFLTRQQDDVVLGDPADIVVDVQQFSEAAQRAWLSEDPALAQKAAAHYTGDLLPEDPFEDWATHRRTDLRISFLALLSRLAGLYESRGDHAAAIAATQQLLATEPLDEAAHVSLIRLYARLGSFREALAQYDALAALLAQELDTEPDAATSALRDEIHALAQASVNQPPLVVARPPAPAASAMAQFDVLLDLDLIGRNRELAELSRLLERHRLITLIGPAGVGKTRLAEAVLMTETARGRPGRFVDLAAVMQPELLVGVLADALGATEPETEPTWEALAVHVGQSNLLLVLDNFEQILDAAPMVANLLRACPRLAIIATTRERLRLRAEHVYSVTPLLIPESAAPWDEVLAGNPAIELFLQRATNADPGFEPNSNELDAIAEICQRVDGLPLAIELAAARIRVLPPLALLSHMAHPLPLLVGGPRDAPARQQTMRAAIAWSADLLDEDTRTLYWRLGSFPGSFSVDAAKEIAYPEVPGEKGDDSALLNRLEELLDTHLLRRIDADAGNPRFAMLTVVREYAKELLDGTEDASSVRARHAGYFHALATAQSPLLTTESAGTALTVLEQELPNLRTAISTHLDLDNGDKALAMATTLWRFWLLRGHISEGRKWLEKGLTAAGMEGAALRGAALDAEGVLAFAQGDFEQARQRHEAALRLARDSGDLALAAQVLVNLGAVADEQGLPKDAAMFLEEALRASRAIGDDRATAVSLANLGQVAISLGEYARAADLLNESVHAFRALGDTRSEAAILANLGLMSLMAGDAAVARHCHQGALRVFRELGDRPAEAAELLNLGHATQKLGDWTEADSLYGQAREQFERLGDRSGVAFAELHLGKLALLRSEHHRANEHLVRALESAQEIGDWVATAESLEGLTMLYSETDAPVLAAQSLGAAEELRESLGLPLPAVHHEALSTSLERLESMLSITELAEARATGASKIRRHLSLIQAGDRPSPLIFMVGGGNSSAA